MHTEEQLLEKLNEVGTTVVCPAVVIVRDKTVLIGLRHYTSKLSLWTMPGGRCIEGETVEKALRREVEEEIGITDLVITDMLGIIPGARAGDIVYLFVGTSNSEPQLREPDKFSEWRWVQPKELPGDFISPPAAKLVQAYV